MSGTSFYLRHWSVSERNDMWGPATAIAISELHRLAENSVLQVRAKLFRLGYSGVICVQQKETSLELKYGDEILIRQPLEILTIINEIHEVENVDDWLLLKQDKCNNQNTTKLIVYAAMFYIMLILVAVATNHL